ncbi:GNAT family N-acetyltransferase [Streptomyces sp. NPDC053542]|uniref:GNAT family N-acetyltransferase n=1 Tax=Streptomyces sp. NPDC053542 TaxID=3365710 RepID=UPI0037D7B7C1
MSPVTVRPATPADAAAISQLLGQVIRDSYSGILDTSAVQQLVGTHCSLSRLHAEIGIPGGAPGWLGWLVAADASGRVVGAAAGGVPMPGEGELYALGTAPDQRHRKIGGTLLAEVTDRMRDHGALRQGFSLPCEQDPALPFFTRVGFERSGTRLTRFV